MNATKWLTLTEFVQYLGKTGQCRVDETPKGWFISLIQVARAACQDLCLHRAPLAAVHCFRRSLSDRLRLWSMPLQEDPMAELSADRRVKRNR